MNAKHIARAVLVSVGALAGLAATMAIPQSVAQSAPQAATKADACDIDGLAGRWVNVARPKGSDVAAARIHMTCDPSSANKIVPPAVEIGLEVRCLNFVCDWGTASASWRKPSADDTAVLAAHFDQERFERSVAIERPSADHLRVTVTTRFKGLPLSPLSSTYELTRAQ
jgi:hypothetical protein